MATISLEQYEKSLEALKESLDFLSEQEFNSVSYKVARDASIQRFEFCIELSWKVSAKLLGSTSTTARPVVREMGQNSLIEDVELWFSFLLARNKSSHTYDEDIAEDVLKQAKNFHPHGRQLIQELKKL